jgi:MraZ protein
MLGEYKATLDTSNGRMNIPAKFREELGASFYMAKPLDKALCVAVYTIESWNDVIESIRERPREEAYDIKRNILPSAFPIDMDKQGRVKIPQPLLKYAGLETDGEVIVIGIDDTAEIWNKTIWENRDNR